jgi:16S rRNA (guanine(527)-N(7))-methyltransferase RsmG
VLARLSPRRTVLDVGSGAGFPGLPLALFLEDSRFVLLERSARKAAFLGNVVALLGLANVRVLEMQLSGLEERFDLVTFRAWSPLDRELPALRRVLAPGGTIAAYKGRRQRIEAEGCRPGRRRWCPCVCPSWKGRSATWCSCGPRPARGPVPPLPPRSGGTA